MWDFQYRVAMDTYEQLNGKVKVERMYTDLDMQPAKPGLLQKAWRALRGMRTGRIRPGQSIQNRQDVTAPGPA